MSGTSCSSNLPTRHQEPSDVAPQMLLGSVPLSGPTGGERGWSIGLSADWMAGDTGFTICFGLARSVIGVYIGMEWETPG